MVLWPVYLVDGAGALFELHSCHYEKWNRIEGVGVLVKMWLIVELLTCDLRKYIPVQVWANTILIESSPEYISPWGITVRSQWAHCYHCMMSSSGDLTYIAPSNLTAPVANSQKTHSKLTVWVILWAPCEVTESLESELSVRFNVS